MSALVFCIDHFVLHSLYLPAPSPNPPRPSSLTLWPLAHSLMEVVVSKYI
jgi:hypothetical protein